MNYLLDTNICIYIIKKKPPSVFKRFQSLSIGDVGISTITLAELKYGVAKSALKGKNQTALQQFLIPLEIIDFNYEAAIMYGEIRAYLEKSGQPIGSLDMLIAAHAKSLDLTIVTNNEREFRRIQNLKVENWLD